MRLLAPIRSFYIMIQLQKLHKQFACLSVAYLNYAIRISIVKPDAYKIVEKKEHIEPGYEHCLEIRTAQQCYRDRSEQKRSASKLKFTFNVYMQHILAEHIPEAAIHVFHF